MTGYIADETAQRKLGARPMAEHTLLALSMAYVRYLMSRCKVDAEVIREAYFSETGNVPEGRPADFRKWAAHKVHMLDQLGIQPFQASE